MDINSYVIEHEIDIRLSFFFGVFLIMAIWEWLTPKRRLQLSKFTRWSNNIALVVVNSIVLRLLFPAAAVGMAIYAEQHAWGLFNTVGLPFLLAVVISIVLLDAIIYFQHVMVHRVPVLWRLHRVHHADPDIDVTTGSRFHPLEIILSMLIKFAAIALLGAPVLAVIIFEILLNASAMFNHSNIRLNTTFDKYLRLFIVTPDMHRVHHSVELEESNTNFGFNLPWWDRLFGTYQAQPKAGHEAMTIGLKEFREPKQVTWLRGILLLPFVSKK